MFRERLTNIVDADGRRFVGIASPCDGRRGVAFPAVGCPCPSFDFDHQRRQRVLLVVEDIHCF